MISITNELNFSESKIEQALIERLIAINLPLKIIQSIISSMNTCKQKMIEIREKNEKLKTKIYGTIVFVFQYCHCWRLIIV